MKKTKKYISRAFYLAVFINLLFFTTDIYAQAQFRKIKGTVVEDATGDPMPGVTIRIKGRTEGTITDYEGKFSIRAKESDVLIFSFIGMVTQEVPVGLNKDLTITMVGDLEELEEIVVTGYGTTKAKDVTG